jgi:MFS family permease
MSIAGRHGEKKSLHYAWLIFMGCCCMMAGGLGAVLNTSGVFYVPVCAELGFERGELSLYLSFYLISMVVATPVVGNLLPRVNIRILMTFMFVCVCIAEGMMSTYHELWQWYASGVVFGACGSFIFVLPTPLLIGNWFKKRTGLILGIAMSFSGIGTAVFSPLFTLFIATWGWRATYVIVAAIMALLVLPWTLFVFRFRPSDKGMLAFGDSEEDVGKPAGASPAAPGKQKLPPGIPVRVAVLSVPFACIFILSGCEEYFGGLTNQIASFSVAIGETAAFGALMLSTISIGNIVIKIGVGFLADKIGIPKTVYLQMFVAACACVMLAFARESALLLVGAFLLGVQNSVVTVSEPLLVRHYFGERNFAQLYSYIRVAAGLLGALAIPVVGFIYDWTGAYTLAFVIGMGIAAFLALLVFVAERTKHRLYVAWDDGKRVAP